METETPTTPTARPHVCPDCSSRLVRQYVSDLSGEVIGQNLWCAKCPWDAVGGW